MSLFPAYVNGSQNKPEDQAPGNVAPTSSGWLENHSFPLANSQLKDIQKTGEGYVSSSHTETTGATGDSSFIEISDSDSEADKATRKKRKKTKKSNKRKRKRRSEEVARDMPKIEFCGDEDFYVDKKPIRKYATVETLHRPACPKYRTNLRGALDTEGLAYFDRRGKKSFKRYYRPKPEKKQALIEALEENEYTQRQGELNREVMKQPQHLPHWLELIALQDRNPYKWSRLLLAERKLEIIQKAMKYFTRNESLYRLYIQIVTDTYPSFEVSKMFDRLISKDPYNYTLWTAQIMTTQGSMARCIVPSVLTIYERCMQKMHHAKAEYIDEHGRDSDAIMLKLFNNCALFLRQTGSYELFVALCKLALELNVSADKFGNFAPSEVDQHTLIEYEEMILQSGLPISELWLRVEKLRQGYNFLPVPIGTKCSTDPQRIIHNEDVCHYIYPLRSRENSYYLILLILRLFKLPFVKSDCLAEKFQARVEDLGDSDAIEDLLVIALHRSLALPRKEHTEFICSLLELVKIMSVSPTFVNNALGHEIYMKFLSDFLLNCAISQEGIHERRRLSFLLLWCRFERLQLIMEKCSGKLTPEYVKAGRGRFKTLLGQTANLDALLLYTELGIYEYEALGEDASGWDKVKRIFLNLIEANTDLEGALKSDLAYLYVTYAEILVGRQENEEALQLLAAYALGVVKNKDNPQSIGRAGLLSAKQKLQQKLEDHFQSESRVETMTLEQYLLPDYTVNLIKMYVLMEYLVGHRKELPEYMERLFRIFKRTRSERHGFVREHIHEIYITLLQLPNLIESDNSGASTTNHMLLHKRLSAALEEYPRNLCLLQSCCMLSSAAWYKLRSMLLQHNPAISSVVFLIVLSRCRFNEHPKDYMGLLGLTEAVVACDSKYHENIARNRIMHIFKGLEPVAESSETRQTSQQHNYRSLHRNALYWRLYLRCLSSEDMSFEVGKKCLLMALDECPWAKALYLDGASYVPQEMAHLQDLIIEKQLRIYALPEELDILREK